MNETHSPASSRLSTPEPLPPIQPAYFYPPTQEQPPKGTKGYWDPEDDPLATRGIPVFQPSMDEFNDFEGYMEKVEHWGNKSGIIKVVPPKEWREALAPINPLLSKIRIRNAIEQHMDGSEGMYHQKNVEKRRTYSVREWADLCMRTDMRAPTREELGRAVGATRLRAIHSGRGSRPGEDPPIGRDETASRLPTPAPDDHQEQKVDEDGLTEVSVEPSRVAKSEPPEEEEEEEAPEDQKIVHSLPTPPGTVIDSPSESPEKPDEKADAKTAARSAKKARLEARLALDEEWLKTFDPAMHWLPPGLKPEDYNPEFCQLLERNYWRSCGLQGKRPMYGADLEGSLFTDATKHWNVAHLPSALERLLPSSNKRLPGVNTPYLYWGMWRATFAWHVEDMDLFSINYIHHGAPKHWYAIPQEKSSSFENAMKAIFPSDTRCPQFLRHKAFLVSPTRLSRTSIKPNTLVQHAGEFVVTFPRGYHAGFNMGFNCAESVNFALESWVELGRKAKVCRCVGDSVVIDVEQLLEAKANPPPEEEPNEPLLAPLNPKSVKRKANLQTGVPSKKLKPNLETVTVKIPPPEILDLPCCLCVGTSVDDLLPVHDPPASNTAVGTRPGKSGWMAHERCAKIVPETWVDEADGKLYVYGVDAIVRDRWNLKCNACTKLRAKAHGAPIQCTKGKCPKAFHVSCATSLSQVDFTIIEEVEKQVVIVESEPLPSTDSTTLMDVDSTVAPVNPPAASTPPEPKVIKSIWKSSYELLCPQHNPVVIQARKTEKLGAAREHLANLLKEPTPRIRIRNSSGTFEVSLVSVDEERGTVIVLWDGNVHREFKWGSIVWGAEGKAESKEKRQSNEPSVASKPRPVAKPKDSTQKPAAPYTPGMYYPPASNFYQTSASNAPYPQSYLPSYPAYGYPYPTYYYPPYMPLGEKSGVTPKSFSYSVYQSQPQPLKPPTNLNKSQAVAAPNVGPFTSQGNSSGAGSSPQAQTSTGQASSSTGLKALSEAAASAETS